MWPWMLLSCQAERAVEPAVIVLVMDGVRAEDSLGELTSSATGLEPWQMMPRVWSELVPQGVRATAALNIGVTITAPAHCELLSGRRQPFANYPVETGPGAYRPELPSLMEAVRVETGLSRPRTILTGNTTLIQPMAHSLWSGDGYDHGADFVLVSETSPAGGEMPALSDGAVFAALRALLKARAPRLVIANLHAVDRAGHYGDTLDYPQKVQELDDPIAAFWADLQQLPAYRDRTYLVLLSDHGRHRVSDGDPPWREHGDDCMGCRHIPLLILGPEVRAGTTVDAPVLLADLAPTLGALLGAPMPWAEGRMLSEMFTLALPASRTGVADVAVASGALAQMVYGDDPYHRSWIEVDGQVLSAPEALAAEAPVMVAEPSPSTRRWLCFREITVSLDAAEAPWTPRCFVQPADTADWLELPPVESHVHPFWAPVLLPDGAGGLEILYAHNPNGHAETGGHSEGEVGLRGRYYGENGEEDWGEPRQLSEMTFPEGVAALDLGDEHLWAVAAAPATGVGRAHRQIRLVLAAAADTALFSPHGVDFRALSTDPRWRVERPALGLDAQGQIWLAAVATEDAHSALVLASSAGVSETGALEWSMARRVDGPGRVLPHLTPRWLDDGDLLFAVEDEDGAPQAALCRLTPADTLPARCQGVGSPRILDLEVEGDQAWVVRDTDVGQWELYTIPLDF